MSWPTVPSISNGITTLDSAGLGAITDALSARTEELNSQLGNHYNNAIVITDAPVLSAAKGTVVYYDTNRSCYLPAEPVSEVDPEQRILPGSKAYIAGIVFSDPTPAGAAQILLGGAVTSDSINIVGSSAGPYYLTASGGMALTPQTGELPIYCGYLNNNGWFIFNPDAPSDRFQEQTIAPPLDNIIASDGISGGMISGTRTATLTISLGGIGANVTDGQAVGNISGGSMVMVPVVNTLTAGAGVEITPATSGALVISATGLSPYIDFQTINANNVLIGGAVNDSLITFPAGVDASVVGIARLPHNVVSGAQVFAWVDGVAPDLTVSGGMLYSSSGAITSTTLSASIAGGGTDNTITELVTTNFGIGSGQYSDGLVKVVIQPATTPKDPIYIKAVGIKLS